MINKSVHVARQRVESRHLELLHPHHLPPHHLHMLGKVRQTCGRCVNHFQPSHEHRDRA